MRHRTLIAALPVFVGLAAIPAHAQQAGGEPTEAFCALAGTELLAALDGSWTINQGRGTAHAGAMTIPLPAPPAAPVTFEYDSEHREIDVRSADLADEMIMFPVAPVQQAAAHLLIGEPPAEDTSTQVCAWPALPTLIGTNTYVAWSEEHWLFAMPGPKSTCDQIEDLMANQPEYGIAKDNEIHNKAYYDEFCRGRPKELPEGGTLEMEMTLVLRFVSAGSGAGMVYFTGKTDKARFAASAPVQLSR